ncbi:MAG: hypothetical protein LUO89_04245 [Methanothrix sp.]|nr:hypothetical protein [Methanothrix sp.]
MKKQKGKKNVLPFKREVFRLMIADDEMWPRFLRGDMIYADINDTEIKFGAFYVCYSDIGFHLRRAVGDDDGWHLVDGRGHFVDHDKILTIGRVVDLFPQL